MVIHDQYGKKAGPPSPRDRWSAAGIAVGASVIAAAIALFTGNFGIGAIALVFCLLVALLHANAVEPGKLRAPIAVAFLAASGACAALAAVAGAHGVAVLISGWLVTGLYYAGLLIGVFKRLDLFHRLLALLLATVSPIALLQVQPPPPSQPQPDPDKWRIELTVIESDGQPLEGARAACWTFETPEVEIGLIEGLRSELTADFTAPTDEAGRATLEFTADPAKLLFVCGAAYPNVDGRRNETTSSPTTMSPPYPVPPARATVPIELRFSSGEP